MLNKIKVINKPLFWFSLLFFIVLVYLFWQLLFNPNLISSNGDLRNNFWSVYAFLHQQFQISHLISLWYPVKDSGISLSAHPSFGLGYPLNWLFFFLPTSLASTWIIFLSLGMIGIFSFILTRYYFRLSLLASVFYAISLMLTPKFFGHIYAGHMTLIAALPYIPFILFSYLKLFATPGFKWSLSLAVGIVLMYLTGGPQLLFYTLFSLLLLSTTYIFYIFFKRNTDLLKATLKEFKWLIITMILVLGLSAFQLLPAIYQVSMSQRANLGYWEAAIPGLYFNDIKNLLTISIAKLPDHETIFFFGIIPLILIPFSLLYRKQVKWLILVVVIFTLLFSFGANTPIKIHHLLFNYFPGFNLFRVPTRMLFIFFPYTLLLSSFGLEWLINHPLLKKRQTIFGVAIILISTLQLITIDKKFIQPVISPDKDLSYLTDSKLLDNLTNKTIPPPRIYTTNRALPEDVLFLARSQSVDGTEDLFLENYVKFMKLAGNYKFDGYSSSIPPSQTYDPKSVYYENPVPNASLLGLLNTKYIFSPTKIDSPDFNLVKNFKNLFVYENKKLLPRSYLIFNAKTSTDINALNKLKTDKEILVTPGEKEINSPNSYREIPILKYSPTKITTSLKTSKEAYFVLAEVNHPDWHVKINQKEGKIVQVNNLLRGVYLQPGEYSLEFYFKPNYLYIIITGMMGLLILIICWHRRPRHLGRKDRKSHQRSLKK